MRQSIRLGSIAGIPIGAGWSVVVIAALLTTTLAGSLLPASVPGLPGAAYLAGAGLGALVFLASLVAHELGHALVARRAGVPTESITLWALGGVARLACDAPDARAEARIAVAGPAVSLLLAAGFAAVSVGADLVGGAALLVALLGWLAVVNLTLGVFNLLPGFPLDGGRLLRALVWWRRGPDARLSATATAARAGRVVGVLLVAVGVLEYLTFGWAGIWTALIGWFLVTAARLEETGVRREAYLADRDCAAVMTPLALTSVTTSTPLAALVDLDAPALVEDPFGRTAGIVDPSVVRLAARRAEQTATSASAVMWPMSRMVIVAADAPASTLPDQLDEQHPVALVRSEGRFVGLIGPTELNGPVTPPRRAAAR